MSDTAQAIRRGTAGLLGRTLTGIGLFVITAPAFACIAPKVETYRPATALVEDASSILLVKVKARPDGKCVFVPLESRKGLAPKPIALECRLANADEVHPDFERHTSRQFWAENTGRLSFAPHCGVMPPRFKNGHQYLLFFGVGEDIKMAEDVSRAGDQWLRNVRLKTRPFAPNNFQ